MTKDSKVLFFFDKTNQLKMTQTPKTVVQMVVFISVTVLKKRKKRNNAHLSVQNH